MPIQLITDSSRAGRPAQSQPGWWTNAVFYHLLVDRFAPSESTGPAGDPTRPEFCGGDLLGVIRHLDYLRELGVTAIWLSPINRSPAYHGYHVTDFMAIEERFGGQPALQALLAAAGPDMKIIMDFVPNHVHCTHPFFLDARSSSKSRYRDWFYFDTGGRYLCFLDFDELPKLNLDHPEARQHIIDSCLHWLSLGIAGFRMDHALGPSIDFWQTLREAIKQRHPNTFVFGEATLFGVGPQHLKTLNLPRKQHYMAMSRHADVTEAILLEYSGVFDGLLDFEFQRIVKTSIARAPEKQSFAAVQSLLDAHYARFKDNIALLSFLDNHDMNRFLFECSGDRERLVEAATLQFKQGQPPVIYYGTELGMGQTASIDGDYGDLHARAMMPWKNGDEDLLSQYKTLINLFKTKR